MEPFYLMPGQERCEQFKDANGVPKVRYSYCSLNGALFRCVSAAAWRRPSACARTGWWVRTAATPTEKCTLCSFAE